MSLLIDPEERGKKFGSKIRVLCRYLFHFRGLNKVHVQTTAFNKGAIKITESLRGSNAMPPCANTFSIVIGTTSISTRYSRTKRTVFDSGLRSTPAADRRRAYSRTELQSDFQDWRLFAVGQPQHSIAKLHRALFEQNLFHSKHTAPSVRH